MSARRQRRKDLKARRHRHPVGTPPSQSQGRNDFRLADRVERLAYTRKQAAEALGVSLSTLDRRVVPAIATIHTGWGERLIPVAELKRFLAERTREAQRERRPRARPGRKPGLPREVITRIQGQHAKGVSLGAIARSLNADGVPTSQGGRQWWPSAVRAALIRRTPPGSA
jgi:Recombinase